MLLLSRYKIVGHSMEPFLHFGQTVLISNLPYIFFSPTIGDVVLVEDQHTGKKLLKRITKIELGKYFLTGDNKHDSLDSRTFGTIPRNAILGKLIAKL